MYTQAVNLKGFIERVGDTKAAKLFGVKTRTAAAWRRGERQPRPKQVKKIIKASGGELSYETIYGTQVTAKPAQQTAVA